jgi:hypothetical protein
MAFYEALLIVVPAVIVAPWLATLLVAAVSLNPALAGVGLAAPWPGPATFAVAAGIGVLALLALTVPTLAGGVSIGGVRAVVGRQLGRTLPQRLGLDLALVLLAAVALLQLRLYGAPLTRDARGSLGVDPLLVAAPAIGLLGGAVLAIRIVPRLAELAEGLLSRGRGLVASLGGRQLARRPLRYTRAALLLVLAAALGTFAAAHAATWTRSQSDQAAFATGADVRAEPGARSAVPVWSLGEALRALPDVTVATPVVAGSVSLGSATARMPRPPARRCGRWGRAGRRSRVAHSRPARAASRSWSTRPSRRWTAPRRSPTGRPASAPRLSSWTATDASRASRAPGPS